jgi:hypothetical protein
MESDPGTREYFSRPSARGEKRPVRWSLDFRVLGFALWIHETFGAPQWSPDVPPLERRIHVSESGSMHCRPLLKHTKIFIPAGGGSKQERFCFPEKVQSKRHYQMDTLGLVLQSSKRPGERWKNWGRCPKRPRSNVVAVSSGVSAAILSVPYLPWRPGEKGENKN